MPKKAAQGVNVHAAHKTAFGKVVPQAMGRDIFAQSRSAYVALEVCLIGVNIHMSAGVLDREEVITLDISVLVLQPSSDCSKKHFLFIEFRPNKSEVFIAVSKKVYC